MKFKSSAAVKQLLTLEFFQMCGALRDLIPFVQLKKIKNAYGGVLLLVKFTKSNTPP